ncbi:MAG: FAD-binding protein, partial [Muribaculaceae bacterium]|nr:FAD-binding protein [Muribaculaceae bacterium]
FILAGGSFFSHGLVARPDSITEPIFGLDVHTEGSRGDWFNKDLYSDQPFMKFGIRTDGQFRTMKNGAIIPNLYGCGSILAGANAMKEGSGAGIAILTALNVAQNLSSNTSKN